ncbi:MAG: hypothetical protein V4525_14170 [Pseudomonadota bacterium]
MQPDTWVKSWEKRVYSIKNAHYQSAYFCEMLDIAISVMVIFSAAFMAVVALMARPGFEASPQIILIMSIAIIALVAGQHYFKFSERSIQHRHAADAYLLLVQRLEPIKHCDDLKVGEGQKKFNDFFAEWIHLAEISPALMKPIYKRNFSHFDFVLKS